MEKDKMTKELLKFKTDFSQTELFSESYKVVNWM